MYPLTLFVYNTSSPVTGHTVTFSILRVYSATQGCSGNYLLKSVLSLCDAVGGSLIRKLHINHCAYTLYFDLFLHNLEVHTCFVCLFIWWWHFM